MRRKIVPNVKGAMTKFLKKRLDKCSGGGPNAGAYSPAKKNLLQTNTFTVKE